MKDLILARNGDFRRRCIRIFNSDYNEGAIRPLDSVLERAINTRPLCHYLSYDTASKRLHAIRRHGLTNVVKEKIARQMWAELAGQVSEIMSQHPDKSFEKALSFVLNFCRPSRFHISLDTARRIVAPDVSYHLSYNTSTL